MTRPILSLAAAALALPGAALAQATPQGAAELTAVFQTYLGTTPGVVNVVPDGAAYLVTIDASPFFGMIPPEANATVAMSPQIMRLTDNGNGTWGYVQDQPFTASFAVPGVIEMQMAIASAVCEGTFDAALKGFTQNACKMSDFTMSQRVTDPVAGQQNVSYRLASLGYESTAAAGANGGVDGRFSYTAAGLEEVIELPLGGPGAPPLPVRITLADYTAQGTTTGVRNGAFLELLAWFVANPSQQAMAANKAGAKAIIEGGLPLWENIAMTSEGRDLVIETPFGPVRAAGLGVEVSLNGAVADGLFRERISLTGITPPPGILPPFAEQLIPERFAVDFQVENYDAAAASRVLLGLFDLPPGAEPGPDFGDRLLSALLPSGEVGLRLAPAEIANSVYSLNYEGWMTAGPATMPTGAARVTAAGLNEVMAILDGAPEEVKMNVLPALGMAVGIAQQQPDGSLLWDIDATEPGTLKVNGMDLMGMQ